ncbi:class A sortase [Ligilactobacillus sp. LYQ135]
MSKIKKFLYSFFMIFLVCLGLALIFNEQIKTYIVHHMQENALEQPINQKKPKNGQFDATKVGAVSSKDVAKAATQPVSDSIGKIAIPDIGLKLPIFYGMSNSNMVRGACTMRADEQMGMLGNYTLAGHHMLDNNLLFGPLQNAKKGQLIYLTDGKQVFVYKIETKTVVDEHQTQWLDSNSDQHLITLVTCASGQEGETRRIIIRGILQSTNQYDSTNSNLFKYN